MTSVADGQTMRWLPPVEFGDCGGWHYPALSVSLEAGKGLGVKALSTITRGTLIMYGGALVSRNDRVAARTDAQQRVHGFQYVVELEDGSYLDGWPGHDPAEVTYLDSSSMEVSTVLVGCRGLALPAFVNGIYPQRPRAATCCHLAVISMGLLTEPSAKEVANLISVSCFHQVWLAVVRDIMPGEYLLWLYPGGPQVQRSYAFGEAPSREVVESMTGAAVSHIRTLREWPRPFEQSLPVLRVRAKDSETRTRRSSHSGSVTSTPS